MKSRFIVLILSSLLLFSCKISGKILHNNEPLQGVKVILSDGLSRSTITSTNGDYSFEFQKEEATGENFTIRPVLPGYIFSPEKKQVKFATKNEISNINFSATIDVRPALIDLYNSTHGDSWSNNSGWKAPPTEPDGFSKRGSEANWYGIEFDTTSKSLISIDLSENGLTGNIPHKISELSELLSIDLSHNQLSGPIPDAIGSMTNLESIYFGHNQLKGTIPSTILNLKKLSKIELSHNKLCSNAADIIAFLDSINPEWDYAQVDTPCLPIYDALMALYESTNGPGWTNNSGWGTDEPVNDWFGIDYALSSSTFSLDLSSNNLRGTLPSKICTLLNITDLNLSNNHISGPIPENIGNLHKIKSLILHNNKLRGVIPNSIINLTLLNTVSLEYNHLCSSDDNVVSFLNAINPYWGNGQMDTPCHPLRDALMDLYDATNGPQWTNNEGWGTDADLRDWYGVRYDTYSSTFSLDLPENNLQGVLPASISQLSNLTVLDLSENQLTGTLPENIGNMTQLVGLHLSGNQLSGPIPQSIGGLANLYALQLSDNKLRGIIPSSITRLENLSSIMLEFNHLCTTDEETVSFLDGINPNWRQGQMDTPCLPVREILTELFQETNGTQWTNNEGWGTDADLRDWYGVRYDTYSSTFSLDLPDNNLQGVLPASISQLSNLTVLDLSENQLTGTLPENIGNMTQLVGLHLSGNQLSGPIPQSIGDLANLYALQLSDNKLRGIIPSSITRLENLSSIMLEFNHLCTTDEETVSFLDGINPNWRQGQMDTPCLPVREILTELFQETNGTQWTNNEGWGTDADLRDWYGVRYDTYSSTFSLDLPDNNLQGVLPASISQLSNLTVLDLSENQLTGTLPENIGNMTQLVGLHLSGNQLSGPIPQSIGDLANLYALQLSDNKLRGIIPSSITRLENLSSIMLEFNHLCTTDEETVSFLDGINPNWRQGQMDTPCLPVREILTELFQETNGTQWTNNEGWGTDADLRDWYGVRYDTYSSTFSLDLPDNNLQGVLPASISQLSNLTVLDLSENQLTGTLPENIGNMTQLVGLHLSGNQLSGPIPQSIGDLANLYALQLSDNKLRGIIPSSITRLENLSSIMLEFNHLCTTDEETVSFLDGINPNWRQGQMDTPCLPVREILTELFQETNGTQWTNNEGWGTDADLRDWYGVRYDTYSSTFSLDLPDNNLQGVLPASISQLSNLTVLDLSENQLTGTLPENIGNMTQLVGLHLSGNQLSGPIPQSIGDLANLYALQLSDNKLRGIIPSSITRLENLSSIMLEFNHLCTTDEETVSFLDGINPNWRQGQMDTPCLPVREILTELFQETNGTQWTNNEGWGTDADLRDWYGVRYDTYSSTFSLDLPDNNLQGVLPASISQLSNLTVLDLSENQLTGTLPENIGNMTQLVGLHLSGNQLSGPIPQSIGDLANLYALQLSDNKLRGIIPSSITRLENLSSIMLEFNHLCTTDEETVSFLDGINPNWRTGQMDTPCQN
ncbi:leucine-rich repeat domain-containing protein [Desulfoluna spongiiphila]|uniref:hypothetical protein n=1 Tax=Desulfoluna spongiiphila TaxID=419481 RepID=UPI00125BC966|nr:hypothetical protein [Desulfoluna spongiiphila]VVS91449.1 prokaryotic membrane lipoprotein lipid attachment site profile [Desulfoluna spongiiphila]